MDFTDITISDKGLFDRYFREYNPQASELTFTNIFMWRRYYGYRYVEADGFLCIVSVPEEGEPFALVPVGKYRGDAFSNVVFSLDGYFRSKGWGLQFRRVAGTDLEYFAKCPGLEIDAQPDRDNSDYVYLVEDLAGLPGKKYDGKRNHIRRFEKTYSYEYLELKQEHLNECERVLDDWYSMRGCRHQRKLCCEKIANLELLIHYEKLGCSGAIVRVNGRCEAFTIGERLNADTAVIHVEKADSRINGLYAFINRQFCKSSWNGFTFVNREQDLGIEGLRKAKLSYHPVKMVDKYTVRVKRH